MDQILFNYICSKQGEWGRIYRQKQKDYKLQKNRNEKDRVKENKFKSK